MISNDEYSKLLDQQFETKTNISANKNNINPWTTIVKQVLTNGMSK